MSSLRNHQELDLPDETQTRETDGTPATGSETPPGPQPVAAPLNATVVVADDDELVAEIVSAVLDREGIRSVCAYDGSAAIAKVDEHNARALILDIHMPKKSGLEVLRVLKRGDREAPPKVLVLTAQAGRGMEELARANGADDFLAKPFDPYELARRVKRLLGREETS